MITSFKKIFLLSLVLVSAKCFAQDAPDNLPDYLEPDHALNSVTMVMVHDVVSPPVAGRYYAYIMLGAYNIVAANNKSIPGLEKFINTYKHDRGLDTINYKYDHRIAAYFSILETAKGLLPSGFMLQDDEDAFILLLQKLRIDQKTIDNSVKAALIASSGIIKFSTSDNYRKLSALKRYAPLKGEGYWYPTPPGYFEAVEPNWKTIRTMVIDSSRQFKPAPLIPFSKDTSSAFYKEVKEVYNASRHLTTEDINKALFWDCNPFAITTSGHMAIGFKKISPGGHWMHITGLVVKQAHLNFDRSVMVLALEGVTLMDAFINCWDEKYNSNRIRPETYINRYIDIKWQPVLQTPPFPEYTSGHAVISHASAELLTYLFGDNFAYIDNTEIPFGSNQRDFKSFRQAADEASISRFYGGIHYMESIDNGNKQGDDVGHYIISKIKAAGIAPQK